MATYFDKEDYDRYFECAEIFRDSLTTFHLKKKMIDYQLHFKPFQHLNSLNISKYVVQDVVDADKILCCLPHLTQLDTAFHVFKLHELASKIKTKDIIISNNVYPNLKEV